MLSGKGTPDKGQYNYGRQQQNQHCPVFTFHMALIPGYSIAWEKYINILYFNIFETFQHKLRIYILHY